MAARCAACGVLLRGPRLSAFPAFDPLRLRRRGGGQGRPAGRVQATIRPTEPRVPRALTQQCHSSESSPRVLLWLQGDAGVLTVQRGRVEDSLCELIRGDVQNTQRRVGHSASG